MADELQQDGICRYLKDLDYCGWKFFELFGKPGTQFEYDLARIARGAMTESAQMRMTNASFPQELRLQGMKASVRYHSSTVNLSPETHGKTNFLTNKATSLFDAQHTFGAVYDTLKELAEQALFETAIFKLHTSNSSSRSKDGDKYDIAPLFYKLAERVQHLELTVCILPTLGWEATLKKAASLWTPVGCSSPKLKACVFTVVVRSYEGIIPFKYYSNSDLAPFPKEMLQQGTLRGECLGNTLAKLFAEFAEQGPGARRFVRIQHLQCDPLEKSATPQYGPLVAVHSSKLAAGTPEKPSGTSMLTAAYQLARTGEKIGYKDD